MIFSFNNEPYNAKLQKSLSSSTYRRDQSKSHIGAMHEEKERSQKYCEFCENKDLVIGKLKEHQRELLEARNMFINVKFVTK